MNSIEQLDSAHGQLNDNAPAFKLLETEINSIDVTHSERERLTLVLALVRNHVNNAKRTLHEALLDDLRQQDSEIL